MKASRSIKSLAAAAGFAIAATSAAAGAEDFSLMSAPFGTGSYVMASALEQVVNRNHPTIRLSHSETPGFAFNHQQLERDANARKSSLMGTGRGINSAAREGTTPFDKPVAMVKAIANYNLVSIWLVTLDPSIKSISDLSGKVVALGRRPQINWTIQPEALLREGWGLSDIRIEYLGPKEAVTALLDGQADAAVIGGYIDPAQSKMQLSPQTLEFLASGRTAYFLEWGKDAVEKVKAKLPMAHFEVPASVLPGRDQPLQSFSDTVSWAAHEDFPEEAAYQITKLIIENVDEFAKHHSLGKLMSRKSLAYGWEKEEFHPGALRAYREAGILD